MESLNGGLVLEVSSDDETGITDARKSRHCGISDGNVDMSVNKVNVSDDDVMVIDEFCPKPVKRMKIRFKQSAEVAHHDDCVILDTNPEKSMVTVNVNDDDLEIIGEKGEVACRDFPHSRHLCFSFPFASTAHVVHCVLCHCYVCDSPAPCSLWGSGTSTVDHCHASDKGDYWKNQRKCKQALVKPLPVTHKIPSSRTGACHTASRVQRLNSPLLKMWGLNRPRLVSCSLSSKDSTSTTNDSRTHPSRPVAPLCRSQPQLPSPPPSTAHNSDSSLRNINQIAGKRSAPPSFGGASHVAMRFQSAAPINPFFLDRSQIVGKTGFPSSPPVSSQTGIVGAAADDRTSCAALLLDNPSPRSSRRLPYQQSTENHAVHSSLHKFTSSSGQNIDAVPTSYLYPQPQWLSLPLSISGIKDPVDGQRDHYALTTRLESCKARMAVTRETDLRLLVSQIKEKFKLFEKQIAILKKSRKCSTSLTQTI